MTARVISELYYNMTSDSSKNLKWYYFYNPVQSASSAHGSFHENAGRHQKFEVNRWKDPCTVFYHIDEIYSFIWRWYWTKFAVSSHFLRHFYEETRCARQISGIWKTLDKRSGVTDRTLYHSSLLKTFVYLTCFFHVIWHYSELWVLIEYFELLTTQSPIFIESG